MDNSNPIPTQESDINPHAAETVTEDVQKISPIKMTPKIKLLMIGTAVILLIALVSLLLPPANRPLTTTLPSPLPTPDAMGSPVTRPLSATAQTDEFKNFESKLNTTRSGQDSLDTTESQLTFPLLEMNVNYNK